MATSTKSDTRVVIKGKPVRKTQITIRLPDELLEELDYLSKQECRNRSNIIEWLLREAMKSKVKK